MFTHNTQRYRATSEALAAMKRDDIGWDHDLKSGCFYDADYKTKPSILSCVINAFKRRTKTMAYLEHVNFTVSDPQATAAMLVDLFGWHIRWQGDAKGNGYTIHVGTDDCYVAVYRGPDSDQTVPKADASYQTRGGMNHLGVVVDDLDAVEAKVEALGFEAHSHADYDPGRRFYFYDADGVEIEVVQYD